MGLTVHVPSGRGQFAIPRPRTRRERVVAFAMCTAAFLCVYVLSAGPMAGLHKAIALPPFRKAVEFLYAPIIALYESGVEPFSSFLKWYIGLFR